MDNSIKYCLSGALSLVGSQGLAIAAPCGSDKADRPADRKNIVLILADDIGYECIGAYGSTYSTPHLDALAEEGILYSMCFSQPLSTPTRVQLMTGKYNFRNYVEFGYMNPDEVTFANLARDAGYSTCMVGKWQLGASAALPGRFGFDEYCLWQLEQGRKEGAGDRYANAAIECSRKTYARSLDTYGPDIFCDYAIDFIERSKDRPFLLYYADVLVHSPFLPTPDSPRWGDPAGRLKKSDANFPDMVSYMDKNVGLLVSCLKQAGLYEDTIILYIGDNGTHRSIETPMCDGSVIKGGKGLMTDAGTHVPMIVRYPQGLSGVVSDALVDMTDFFPTVADIVGYRIPEGMVVDGHSLLAQFRGDEDAYRRDWVFCHYDPLVNGVPELEKSGRFIRTRGFKLYHDGRFYDLTRDPGEHNPISEGAGSPDAERARSYLQTELSKFPAWKPGDPGVRKKGDYKVANGRNK